MPWTRKESGYEELRNEDGAGDAASSTSASGAAAFNGYRGHRPEAETRALGGAGGDAGVLMVAMKQRYIRKFLHYVLFPSRVAKYFAKALHVCLTEVYVVLQLTYELSRQLAVLPGKKWIVMFLRLLVYSALLMPGFVQVAVFYFFSPRVKRSIVYGPNPRNRLDLYLPPGQRALGESLGENLAVTIFVTGGAWIIGYKAWGCLFGKVLSKEGVLVVSLDYRNFPQGRIKEMLEDVDRGIGWVVNNIHKYGGDPTNICLVGQSAGAHLSSLALIECAEKAQLGARGRAGVPRGLAWTPQQIKAFIGVSGAYDMVRLSSHLNHRGLHMQLLNAIMSTNGKTCLEDISPASRISNYVDDPMKYKHVVDCLPQVVLLHGKDDDSIPFEHAEAFGHVLERAGIPVERIFYEGETHTTPLIENPMRGSGDKLSEGVLNVIRPDISSDVNNNRRLVPEVLIRLALKVSPF